MNQQSINENYVLTVFNIINEFGKIVINCPNCLFGKNVNITFDTLATFSNISLEASVQIWYP